MPSSYSLRNDEGTTRAAPVFPSSLVRAIAVRIRRLPFLAACRAGPVAVAAGPGLAPWAAEPPSAPVSLARSPRAAVAPAERPWLHRRPDLRRWLGGASDHRRGLRRSTGEPASGSPSAAGSPSARGGIACTVADSPSGRDWSAGGFGSTRGTATGGLRMPASAAAVGSTRGRDRRCRRRSSDRPVADDRRAGGRLRVDLRRTTGGCGFTFGGSTFGVTTGAASDLTFGDARVDRRHERRRLRVYLWKSVGGFVGGTTTGGLGRPSARPAASDHLRRVDLGQRVNRPAGFDGFGSTFGQRCRRLRIDLRRISIFGSRRGGLAPVASDPPSAVTGGLPIGAAAGSTFGGSIFAPGRSFGRSRAGRPKRVRRRGLLLVLHLRAGDRGLRHVQLDALGLRGDRWLTRRGPRNHRCLRDRGRFQLRRAGSRRRATAAPRRLRCVRVRVHRLEPRPAAGPGPPSAARPSPRSTRRGCSPSASR